MGITTPLNNAMDRWEEGAYQRTLAVEAIPVHVAVRQQGVALAVTVTGVRLPSTAQADVTAALDRLLGLQVDLRKFYELTSAAAAYHTRAADNGVVGSQIIQWEQTLTEKWGTLHFGGVTVQTKEVQHIFEVVVYLNDLDPKAVRVELYADDVLGSAPLRQEMTCVRQLAGASGGYVYNAAVSAARAPADYTTRIIPHGPGVAVPLEINLILWQR